MKKSYVYLFLCLLLSLPAWSQENAISGVVTDQAGVPLPGASIIEKGTSNGVVSDFDGKVTSKLSHFRVPDRCVMFS